MSALTLNQFNGLDTDAAVRMFRYHAGNTPISYEDAKAVTNLCGNNPMIIKVTLLNIHVLRFFPHFHINLHYQ